MLILSLFALAASAALYAGAALAIGYAVAGLIWLACGRAKPRR